MIGERIAELEKSRQDLLDEQERLRDEISELKFQLSRAEANCNALRAELKGLQEQGLSGNDAFERLISKLKDDMYIQGTTRSLCLRLCLRETDCRDLLLAET